MRTPSLRVLVPAALATLSLLAGCAPFPLAVTPEPRPSRVQLLERPRETTATLSLASAEDGVAVGGDVQRTAAGEVGGRVWAMSAQAKAELVGMPPLAVFAADADGKRTKLWEAEPFPKGSGAVVDARETFAARLPKGAETLIVTTGLARVGSKAPHAEVAVPLAEVPVVGALRGW